MKHRYIEEEKNYLKSFENTTLDLSKLHHKEHIKLTYTLLIEKDIQGTYKSIKAGILAILRSVNADLNKYHETMTYAWVLIVNHFMNKTKTCNNFEEFISLNKQLLDTNILYSHYSKELIKKDIARLNILEADIEKIPLD